MPLYEYAHNAKNSIQVSEQTAASVVSGGREVARSIPVSYTHLDVYKRQH